MAPAFSCRASRTLHYATVVILTLTSLVGPAPMAATSAAEQVAPKAVANRQLASASVADSQPQ